MGDTVHLSDAVEAARLAGSLIAANVNFRFGQGGQGDMAHREKSNEVDLQTKTDLECEKVIMEFLRNKYPGYKTIGEESASSSGAPLKLSSDPTWIIDPIDGTTNFVSGMRCTCVLICLAVNQKVEVAVILDPLNLELFYAEAGKGAFHQRLEYITLERVGEPCRIETSKKTDLAQVVLINDVGYQRDPSFLQKYADTQRSILTSGVRGLRTYGSCGLSMAYVACGRADAHFELQGPNIWDFAPGSLIVAEAGGVVCDPLGGELNLVGRNTMACCSVEVKDQLVQLVSGVHKQEQMS